MPLLLDWVCRSTVLLIVASAAARLLRKRSAALRHRIWALSLAALIGAPILSLLVPVWHSGIVPDLPVYVEAGSMPAIIVAVNAQPAPERRIPLVPVFWSTGFAAVLLRLLSGIFWIRSRMRPLADRDTLHLSAELATVFRVRRKVKLFTLSPTTMPFTWGLFRPAIVLPLDFPAWSVERRRIVISHELAHIERCDWAWQICAEIAKALYWFQPLVWLSVRRLRQESEIACDDVVLNAGIPASTYAGELLDLSRSLRAPARLSAPAVAMARTSDLERRFTSMLNPLINRRRLSPTAQLVTAAVTLAALIPLATLHAQGGKLTGTVYDPDTAIVVNATVTVTNTQTHQSQTTRTNAAGKYSFSGSPPGTYEVVVDHPGFANYRNPELGLSEGRDTNLDVRLALGLVSQTIEVLGKGIGVPQAPKNNSGPARILVGGNVQATKLIRQVKPPYPEEARAAGVEGSVELAAIIGADGRLAAIRVVKSLGYGLDVAAMAAVAQWRYEPTLLNGHPVQVSTTISVNFKLNQP